MSKINRTAGRNFLRATLVAAALSAAAITGTGPARATGACALVPNDRAPSEKILQCGETLTVRPAEGARYRPLYRKGDPLPVGIRLDDGALLIEYHPATPPRWRLPRSAAQNGRWKSLQHEPPRLFSPVQLRSPIVA